MTMELVVDRFYRSAGYTLGKFSAAKQFLCFTLEDPYSPVKVAGQTRIPAGRYEMVLRPEGTKYQKYLTKFGDWQRPGMLYIKNVPGFEWILIHPGNTAKDTEGCLLVGDQPSYLSGSITNSASVYRTIYTEISEVIKRNERVFIEYQDNDR